MTVPKAGVAAGGQALASTPSPLPCAPCDPGPREDEVSSFFCAGPRPLDGSSIPLNRGGRALFTDRRSEPIAPSLTHASSEDTRYCGWGFYNIRQPRPPKDYCDGVCGRVSQTGMSRGFFDAVNNHLGIRVPRGLVGEC